MIGSISILTGQVLKELWILSTISCPSNYEAEAKAIEATLHHLSDILTQMEKDKNKIVIFSDVKSVLKALEKTRQFGNFPELLEK